MGGDVTAALDEAAETAALKHFDLDDVSIVSEEIGYRGEGRYKVVVDPIDGSLNATRGIPFFSLSIAVADGETMDDVHFGYVYDFGAGEEWTASRGGGAWLDGAPLGAVRPKDEIEILSFEATLGSLIAGDAAKVVGLAHRLRIMGSLALSLCHLAARRVDGVCSLKGARAVDIAALNGDSIYGHQQPGGITDRAVRSLPLLAPGMMPAQIISLLRLGGPSFPLANHYDHIHVGY